VGRTDAAGFVVRGFVARGFVARGLVARGAGIAFVIAVPSPIQTALAGWREQAAVDAATTGPCRAVPATLAMPPIGGILRTG
jgi:hypothetical protein